MQKKNQRPTSFTKWFKIVLEVVERPHWSVLMVVLLLVALANAPASIAAVLISCFLAAVLVFAAMHTVGVDNPFNPLSHLRAIFDTVSFWRLLVACLFIGAAFLMLAIGKWVAAAAVTLAAWVHGDENLMLALLVAAIASAFCFLKTAEKSRELAQLEERVESESEDSTRPAVDSAVAAHRYWKEACISLCVAAVALVPAALLANWAWNVLASVALPVLLLSAREAYVQAVTR